MSETVEPKIGQIWKDVDIRADRYVRIVSIGVGKHDGDLKIRKVIKQNGSWIYAPNSMDRWALKRRFNGKVSGYEFVEMPE